MKTYFLKITVKESCKALIVVGPQRKMVDYVVPKDLDSEEGKFTEKQYNDAGGVIRMNMAKALIKRHIRAEENDPNLEIHFITQPSWIESHVRVEETQDDPATDMLNTK